LINKLDGVTGVQQPNRLDAIREANNVKKEDRTDRMEDYLEVIYELVEQKGYATTVDISNFLNVSSSSVTKMMQRLDDTGYLKYEKYRGIRLTEDGIRIAQNIRSRHGLLAEFFRIIGVDEESANNDAEGIEHHLHTETIRKLEEFINILKKNPSLLKRL
jgi:Mn-dependent DtxR family transcriptional regulator